MTCVERVRLQEVRVSIRSGSGSGSGSEECECDLSLYVPSLRRLVWDDLGMTDVWSTQDEDYSMTRNISMIYSKRTCRGPVNPVATRILLDNWRFDPPMRSSDIDVFSTAPHGSVVFCSANKYEPLTVKQLCREWPRMFTRGMPYMRLLSRRQNVDTYYSLLSLYRNIERPDSYDELQNISLHDIGGPVVLDPNNDQVCATIIGAAIALALWLIGFDAFNESPMIHRTKFRR